MAIQTATNFNINTNLPLDTRSHVKTIAERNAIPVGVRYPYMKTTVETDGETYVLVGGLDNTCWVRESAQSTSMGAYKWDVNSEANPLIDEVFILKENTWESTGKTLKEFENDNYNGTWFYVGNGSTDAGLTRYKMIEDGYTTTGYHIDGADGYLNCRDYVIWNGRWVRFNVYEAKSSEVKNADGKYSPKSGVCGLMSSTDKAYLTDLINEYWGKEKLTVYSTPNPPEGWQTNLLFNTGWYLGGIKKDCDGHPPVVNGHHTSWAVLVLNGMATDAESLNHNHRLQLAFDVVNSKIYMRRGWMSENTWADNWDEVGAVADGSITVEKLSSALTSVINNTAEKAHAHENKSLLDGITAEDIQKWNNLKVNLNLTSINASGIYFYTDSCQVAYKSFILDGFTVINFSDEEVRLIPVDTPSAVTTIPQRTAARYKSGSGGMLTQEFNYCFGGTQSDGTTDISALEARISALEAQLGGITLSISDGHITYEKEEATDENIG